MILPGLCSAQDGKMAEIPNVSSYQLIAESIGNGPSSLGSSDNFGRSVANIGDLNNDGIDDIVIGAPNDAVAGTNRGAVYICFMDENGQAKSSPAITRIGHNNNLLPLSNNDYFGTSVAGIGDLNGDGNEDIAVGAYNSNSGVGAVWIIFLNSNGSVSGLPVKITNNSGGIANGDIDAGSQFGMSVTHIGDVNNDGKPDIAVGAPGYRSGEGQVWILRLRANGQVKSRIKISEIENFDSELLNNNDELGYSLAGAGDLNGDRVNDLVVGAPGNDDGYTNAGAFYVIYLDTTSVALDVKKLSNPFTPNYYYPNNTDVGLGRSLSITDVNEDGLPDLMAGVRTFNSSKGGFYFMLMDTLQNITDMKLISFQYGWNFSGSVAQLGAGLCEIKTDAFNSHKRYVTGANLYGSGKGGVYTLDMDPLTFHVRTGMVLDFTKISVLSGNFSGSLANQDFFGIDMAAIGDINGDGYDDAAVGAHGNDDGSSGAGAAWILLLDSLGKVISSNEIRSGSTNFATLNTDHNLGWGMCPAGDFDNDGVNDVFVGAPGDDTGGGDRGCVYLIYLNSNGTVKGYSKIAHTQPTNNNLILKDTDKFGVDVDTIGDIDGNGVVDLVVGAYLNDDAGSGTSVNSGAVYIVMLNSDGSVKQSQRISATQGGLSAAGLTLVSGNQFGGYVDGIGDFDKDGIPDIAVHSLIDGTGAVFILCLNSNGTVKTCKKINYTAGNFPYPITYIGFGSGIQMVDDLDGNGVPDLLISHAGYSTFGMTSRGAIWIAYLDSLGNVVDADIISDSTGVHLNMNSTYMFGQNVKFAGHDEQGNIRLLAGVRDDDGGTDRGGIVVLTVATARQDRYANIYATPKIKEDEHCYKTNSGIFRFAYNEEYNDSNGKLSYRIYKIYGHQALFLAYPILDVKLGQNRYMLNLNTIQPGGTPLPHGKYILEVVNDKQEKVYYKFEKL